MIFSTKPGNFNPIFESVGCICENNGKILLLHRINTDLEGDKWGLPSGKIEDESPEEGVARELFEEVGIRNKDFKFLAKLYVKYLDYDFTYYLYRAKCPTNVKLSLSTKTISGLH